MEDGTLPIGTMCFYKGKRYSIISYVVNSKFNNQNIYILVGEDTVIAYQNELTLLEDINNAIVYEGVLRKE